MIEAHNVTRLEEAGGAAASDFARIPTLLVVEDDSGMRTLLAIYLRSFGYRVLLADGGDEALRMIATHPDVRLLIMDVIMPGLSGQQLLKEIRLARPGIRILFCSGHSAKSLTSSGIDITHENFVQKPCGPVELKRKVEGLLAWACAS